MAKKTSNTVKEHCFTEEEKKDIFRAVHLQKTRRLQSYYKSFS